MSFEADLGAVAGLFFRSHEQIIQFVLQDDRVGDAVLRPQCAISFRAALKKGGEDFKISGMEVALTGANRFSCRKHPG